MSSDYKDRYGIPGKSVTSLIRKFYRYLSDSDWYNADSFVRWCSENDWEKGLRLCKKDASMPHGPDNSFFKKPEMTARAKMEDVRRRKEERKNLVSPFCEGCKTCCKNTAVGCDEYRAWWKKNWDQNICVAPKKPEPKPAPEGSQMFRYEHPDLVREGIIFDGS
jgi:hypothetical protein